MGETEAKRQLLVMCPWTTADQVTQRIRKWMIYVSWPTLHVAEPLNMWWNVVNMVLLPLGLLLLRQTHPEQGFRPT